MRAPGHAVSLMTDPSLKPPPRPQRLAEFRNRHSDGTFIVCGCGESLNLLTNSGGAVTIGVNDVGRCFAPDYLVVINPRTQFSAERFRHIAASQAKALFTQLADLGVPHSNVVTFRLGAYAGTDASDPDVLHYTQNSPYVAVCLALHMGARRIGLIGVDFTDRHFFARTGVHSLSRRLDQINREYAGLGAACRARGVDLLNLSPVSRLTGLPRASLNEFLDVGAAARPAPAAASQRVFFVTYRFLACGDVFTEGLRHAAEDLGVEWAAAAWDDPRLPMKVADFGPDVLFVVHGRSFSRRWGGSFARYQSAVWLLDEPYEVDDSSAYSRGFQQVFVNDPATLACHKNAHYLPVCYDPRVHYATAEPKRHEVGFVGGHNPTRERFLLALAQHGLLSYVVGGPWRSGVLNRYCLAGNTPAEDTAALYRATKIVVNVFRDIHHFNSRRVEGTSLNPRVYEALACGALVISERRPELATAVPGLPTFSNEQELIALVKHFLSDQTAREATRAACADRLRESTYRERLRTIMSLTRAIPEPDGQALGPAADSATAAEHPAASCETRVSREVDYSGPVFLPEQWQICGPVECREADGMLVLATAGSWSPGAERGLASTMPHEGIALAFEVNIPPGACFLAKINQGMALDQTANSYHFYCDDRTAYLARHNHIFRVLPVTRNAWQSFQLTYLDGVLSLHVGPRLVYSARDPMLPRGYAFLGVKAGEVRLRNVRLLTLDGPDPTLSRAAARPSTAGSDIRASDLEAAAHPQHDDGTPPRVSIVTTVYDRLDCLQRCIRSVKALAWRDYEQIIVSDCPPLSAVEEITRLIEYENDDRISYLNLERRFNNWGIAPAAAGLKRARGEFVCFLSDDNGYLPDHLGALVEAHDQDPTLGFTYSSCLYGGRLVLRHPVPGPGRIDLGQPLFRKELFERHFGGGLPFDVMAWDWALIDALLKRGVRWRHVDRPSFVFRLANYPRLVAALP
jgi:hypothetical protein